MKGLFDIQQRIYTLIKERKRKRAEQKTKEKGEWSRAAWLVLVSSNSIIYKNVSQLFEYIVCIALRNTNEIDIRNLLRSWWESSRNRDRNTKPNTNPVRWPLNCTRVLEFLTSRAEDFSRRTTANCECKSDRSCWIVSSMICEDAEFPIDDSIELD